MCKRVLRPCRGMQIILVLYVATLILAALFVPPAHAAESIPHEAGRYQRELTRNARLVWGMDAPVSTFAAQIHTESHWRPDVKSPVGARGIAQFMPGTERWIMGVVPELNVPSTPQWNATNPAWGMRALVSYDRWLWDRLQAADDCERMAMVLAAYNGGLGWVYRDRELTLHKAPGKGPGQPVAQLKWFDDVERFNAGRSPSAFAENRAYPVRILKQREPLYVAAGWGSGVCP